MVNTRKSWPANSAPDAVQTASGKEVSMVRIITAALVVACCGMQPAAGQEAYPSRPIRLIVPYSAGGASDVMARYFGEKLGAVLKQPVIIENQATAAGTIAYAKVARAQP